MNKRMTTILFAAAAFVGVCSSAHAYTTIGEWGGNTVTMRGAVNSFPVGVWRTSLQTVVDRFNQSPSNWFFGQSWGDTSVGIDNGQSEVWFSSSSSYSPAVCYTQYSWWSGDIIEADVIFWNGVAYTTSMNKTSLWPYGGASRPFETTAMHEYGHAAGLGHENDEYNIMGQDWTHIHLNATTCRSYIGEDGCDGLMALYGRWSGYDCQDLAMTHWKYLGESGEYSTHQLCRMYTSAGSTLPSTAFNGQRRYNVTKGTTVRAEFSYENLGETSKTVKVGYYISTNSTISTGDRFLGYGTVTIDCDGVYTTSNTYLYMPTDLTSGSTYYLGGIIDYDNAVAEIDSSNNAAYHIIRVN